MKKKDFEELINKLSQATELGVLSWSVDGDTGEYRVVVKGCTIVLKYGEDYGIKDSYFSVSLLNAENVEFSTMSFYELTDSFIYTKIRDLIDSINDQYYKISESKKLIMDGLDELISEEYPF